MRLSLLALITATAAFALPNSLQIRDDNSLSISGPAQLIHTTSFYALTSDLAEQSDIDTVNWAGAIYTSPPSNTSFTSISGRFTVPTPLLPSPYTPNTKYTAAIWIGLDGLTYQSTILQAGVQISVSLNTTSFQIVYEYRAWTEWYPASPVFFNSSQLAISPGDILDISINSTSPSSGTATLSNVSKQQNITHNLSAPSAEATLKGENAEWIVEDPRNSATTNLPFADFSPITFDGCIAGTADGRKIGSSGSNTVEIYNVAMGKTVTSVQTPGEGVVVVSKIKS